jgi:rubrerythrin
VGVSRPTIKGSKTEHNLLAAFAGESQARNRYSFAASVARKEGYEQISGLFLETADNEKQHDKLFLSSLLKTIDTVLSRSRLFLFSTGLRGKRSEILGTIL